MEKTIIGIDIGGTHFRIGAVSAEKSVTDFRKIPVGQVFHTEDPLADLIRFLRDYLPGKDAQAISIGFPATLDAQRRTVLQAPNVPFMENLPVVAALTEALSIPVFIERDVTMSLRYDCLHHAIPAEGIVCGIYYGTGIGNAISINGIPLVGQNGTAGELGHIPVDGSDAPCGCGNTGCMEALAGGKALAQIQRLHYPHTPISEVFLCHSNDEELLRFVDRMAIAAATEINILNPHHILIGGGIPAMNGFPRQHLLDQIRFHARKPFPAEDLNILFTDDKEDKAVIGAAIHAEALL
jgi:allose kinase